MCKKYFFAVFLLCLLSVAGIARAQSHPACICTPGDPKKPCPTMMPCQVSQCTGTCLVPNLCVAEGSCTQGDGKADPAGKGGAEQMAQMAQKLMEMLQKKGGGGGGGGAPPADQEKQTDPNAYDNVLGSIFNATSTATSTAGRTQQILDSIGENFGNSAITTEVRAIAEEIASTAASVTTISDIAQEGSTTTSATNAKAAEVTTPATQTKDATNGKDTGFTASSIFGNSGVGAFFGVITHAVETAAQTSSRFIGQVCTNRPWDNSIVSSVFTTGFFDNLCVSRGYQVPVSQATKSIDDGAVGTGRATLSCPVTAAKGEPFTITWSCPTGRQSGGVGFATNGLNRGAAVVSATSTREYVLECSDGTKDRCSVRVGVPKVDLTASPAFVQLGGRARLYWTSENVQSCELTGVGMRQQGLSGAAMSPSIYDRSTFTVTCAGTDGETVKDTTIVDIGL